MIGGDPTALAGSDYQNAEAEVGWGREDPVPWAP